MKKGVQRTTKKQLNMLLVIWSKACKTQNWKSTFRSDFTRRVLGEVRSWKELNNKEVDRLKDALLEACDTVVTRTEEDAERERFVWNIETISEAIAMIDVLPDPDAYVESISMDINDTSWRNLPLRGKGHCKDLANIMALLNNRLYQKISRMKKERDQRLKEWGWLHFWDTPVDQVISRIIYTASTPAIYENEEPIPEELCPF